MECLSPRLVWSNVGSPWPARGTQSRVEGELETEIDSSVVDECWGIGQPCGILHGIYIVVLGVFLRLVLFSVLGMSLGLSASMLCSHPLQG